ncbi:MAG: hypothetical protein JJE04_23005 [Acidobacteriia bacterium]|nr:hypothetical protein [Terriglobia bacterium]
MRTAALLALIAATGLPASSQPNPEPEKFFRQNVGLSQDQIAAIRNGQPVAKVLPSRRPGEIFLFGAIYIHTAPEKYFQYVRDLERLRNLPGYLALGVNNDPSQLVGWKGFSFDSDDIQSLKNCKLGDCQIQMPASSIQELRRSIDWSAPDVNERVNQLLQQTASQFLSAYKRQGNQVLGVYNDKRDPTEVARQFAYMLSYVKALPERLPDFYNYLLSYPDKKPANVDDAFYWAKVKFGLKPTLRIVHVLTMRGNPADTVAYAVAEKQLYASHYFETALDLSFCVRGSDDPNRPTFYLIMTMGSEQDGLTGVKGSIVRKVAVDRSTSSLRSVLTNIRNTLERDK